MRKILVILLAVITISSCSPVIKNGAVIDDSHSLIRIKNDSVFDKSNYVGIIGVKIDDKYFIVTDSLTINGYIKNDSLHLGNKYIGIIKEQGYPLYYYTLLGIFSIILIVTFFKFLWDCGN